MDQTDLAADPASTTYQVLSSLYLDIFIVKWELNHTVLRVAFNVM